MFRIAAFLALVCCAQVAAAEIVMDTVPVGNPGNADDTHGDGYGGVDYTYRIGTHEVTVGQYCAFLNAVAKVGDPYELYDRHMPNGCQIVREGGDFNYSYRVEGPDDPGIGKWEDRPVNFVDFGDAVRFCNWLHNGQPAGPQDLTTTEDGAYFLDGATSNAALLAVVREDDWTWAVASEDEWYKAAYHKNDGVTGNYYDYPTRSDSLPGRDPDETTAPGNNANYFSGGYLIDDYGRSVAGEFELSHGPYGTFDQGGNVLEWNEAILLDMHRGLRGGSYETDDYALRGSHRSGTNPASGFGSVGFRVVSVPEPSCVALLTCGAVASLLWWRRKTALRHFTRTHALLRASTTVRGLTAIAALLCCMGVARAETLIGMVTVGNPENAPDTRYATPGFGGVDYVYNIGRYEVTAGQYCEFLNAVAQTDPYGLYSTRMDSDSAGCQITRLGSSGNYRYDFSGRPSGTEADWANRPVNYVSWGDAARFCNWLHNGRPTGPQDATATEDGAYFLDGLTGYADLLAVEREPDWTWAIPTEDEWYKAAYHLDDGPTGNYVDYPTGARPASGLIDPDPGNRATFDRTTGAPYHRTEVGAHENSASAYGTFDQGGNVWEWNEAILSDVTGHYRGLRGGGFEDTPTALHAWFRLYYLRASSERAHVGFRVVSVPEPSGIALLVCALPVLAVSRRLSIRRARA